MELQEMLDSLWSADLYKIVLSGPRTKSGVGERKVLKVVLNRLAEGWQAEKYTEKQVFHENLPEQEARQFLLEELTSHFRQCNGWDGEREHMIRISRGGKAAYQKKRAAQAPKAKTANDREKNYILKEGTVIPPLVDMGIFTAEGKCTETTYLRNAGKGGMRRETARKPAIPTGKRHFSGGKGFAIINNLENEGIGFEQGPFLMPWSGQKSSKTQRRTHGR